MKRITLTRILAGTALGLVASTALAQEEIRIGGIASMSGSGASIGNIAQIGWKLAVDEINEAGGIDGKKVVLVIGDTMTDPTHGVAEARRLIGNEGVVGLVGPLTSQETIPITQVTTERAILQVTTAASPDLTPQFAPYHFSNSPTGVNQILPALRYAVDVLGVKKIALISDNGGMSKAAISELTAEMAGQGLTPTAVQEFAFKTEDMTPQIFSLRNSGAEAVLLINSLGDDTRQFLQNLDEIGWDVPVLGSLTISNYAVGNAKILGEEAFENVYGVQFSGMTYCEGDPVGESDFAKFSSRAEAAIPDLERMGGAAALAPFYIEPWIVKAGIEGAGSADGKAAATWIEGNIATMPNMLGEFRATQKTHFLPSENALVVVKAPHIHREDGLVARAVCP